MAKVFTITDGLENLGALKSGGQGSVYKAKRSNGAVSAVKILPTPISSESDDDKNFISFQNEVEKLKKVNEVPSPNVVSILSSGITSTGNLPFIEMEFIEGPDLGELLTPPHDAVFTIKETIKVATHLSNALAHCHRAAVMHGDIKSNNVKFNRQTGNYMLLDFGLSVMSDEQRRTSMRYAGAIEFMAPEQSAGENIFETDVYSFGIILFELLAGRVPFPLTAKGEMGRNAVMVAHMEAAVPDLLLLRPEALPATWSNEQKTKEMQVPVWLLDVIATCLEKRPSNRYKNGIELKDFIKKGIAAEEKKNEPHAHEGIIVQAPLDDSRWREQVQQLQAQILKQEHHINDLKYQVESKDREIYQLNMEKYSQPKRSGISRSVFFTVLILAVGLTGYAFYNVVIKPGQKETAKTSGVKTGTDNTADSSAFSSARTKKKTNTKAKRKITLPAPGKKNVPAGKQKNASGAIDNKDADMGAGHQYRIKNLAFFYEMPDKHSLTGYYVAGRDVTLTSLQEQPDFVYVEFSNKAGKITRTWLARQDLNRVKQ
ncbi:MAG: protein kinase [Ferruginibacter sp.]|nr:protein kinase [Ferruginibacter sp.]